MPAPLPAAIRARRAATRRDWVIGVAFGLGWVTLLATVDLTAGHRFAFGFAFTVAFALIIGEIVAAIRRACR